ncbi:MAG: molybdopterin molybdotransferase MoeA [Phycisphaeraceae bacterium]|nr:molybdopterin molybdotransferase MoeA [Phycisphaeraceae bacterium]
MTSAAPERPTITSWPRPDAALTALCDLVQPMPTRTITCAEAAGLVLAESIHLDRPSPACDVSAMDGYAVRLTDRSQDQLPVHGEVQPGEPAPTMPPGMTVRVFTGAMIPGQAQAVIPREQVMELPGAIRWSPGLEVRAGQHIRRQGENSPAGRVATEAGRVLTSPMLAAIAACGAAEVRVHMPVRVGVLITGGEVLDVHASPDPWQLRDANGPALLGLLTGPAWLTPLAPRRVIDDPRAIERSIRELLDQCDALLVTGGVSAGDHDHVPSVLSDLGMRIVFHRLTIRPGKPVLGAVDGAGRPVLALPGNPVSVMVTARRLAVAALRKRAGLSRAQPLPEIVEVADVTRAPAGLTWFAAARIIEPGRVRLTPGMGSGDWVTAAGADGFVEVPPGEPAKGPRPFYRWTLGE